MNKFYLKRIASHLGTVVFTWDDNLLSHGEIIAPLFAEANKKCSFYINPGEQDFLVRFSDLYLSLKKRGFEIGSHGYTHHHFSQLNSDEYIAQLQNSRSAIDTLCHIQPTTFAFPHHDFDEKMLSQARNIYFETRNTLYNSVRFSLKVSTTIEEIDEALRSAEQNRYTLVFSGHGAFNLDDEIDCAGYEPVSRKMLTNILEVVEMHSELQICTFEQAALKTYLHYYCKAEREAVYLTNAQIDYLKQYGFTIERINNLL